MLDNTRFRLLHRLFLKTRYLQNRADVQAIGTALTPYWIIGRDISIYRHANYEHIPRSKRQGALRQQIKLWSPFQQTEHFVLWQNGRAQVWFWDKQAQIDALKDAGITQEQTTCLPEVLLQEKPADGLYIKKVSSGYDLQCWVNGELEASAWSFTPPNAFQLNQFISSLKNGRNETELLTLEQQAWLVKPWAKVSNRYHLAQFEYKAVGLSLLLASTALIYQSVGWLEAHLANQALEQEQQLLNASIAPVLSIRQELQSLRSENKRYIDYLSKPGQISLMLAFDEALPDLQYKLVTWNYSEGNLELELESDDRGLTPQTYVQALEASPVFFGVSSQPSRQKNTVKLLAKVL